jgi:glycosyltransferase involved in cell wall biosynthesis
MSARGAPLVLARLGAAIPLNVAQWVATMSSLPRALSALRVPGLIADGQSRFNRLISKVDHIVAVCDWVAAALRANGAQESKLSISRQGIAVQDGAAPSRSAPSFTSPIRIGYFGRIDPTKGVDLIAPALAQLPHAALEFHLHLVRQPGSEPYLTKLEAQALLDRRIQVKPALQPSEVGAAMAACHFVIVPSRWLETGPLVVLEAFAAGVPVIGARRGGIAELVDEGINGLLFAPESSQSLAATLNQVVNDPALIDRLRRGVLPPRTTDDVAIDMAKLYRNLLGISPGCQTAPLAASMGPEALATFRT